MKRWLVLGALMTFLVGPPTHVMAQGPLTEEQKKVIRESVREWMETEGRKPGALPREPGEGAPPGRPTGPFTGGGTLLGGRTIYAKPFLTTPKAILGGYMDFEVTDCNGNARDCSEGLEFDQVRFIPFIYSNITERIQVAAEIEIEHGGPQNNQKDGDIKIEFATFDYLIEDWVNFRAGIILSPLGRFNLLHDSPLNDLTLRPMVSRLIIPSTLSESGLGLYGTFYPTRLSKVDYEFYLVQGFTDATLFSEAEGLRKSKGSQKTDNNENKAILSRVAFSPFLGVELGGSIHHGKWDALSNKDLTITALDWTLQRGPFEIIGESAWASIEGGSPTPSATVPPARMTGFYVQGNYHFMPEFLKRVAPTHFTDASTFTGVVRYGEVDTNTQSDTNRSDLKRLTLGLNFRPIEDTVFKLSYTFNDEENPADGAGATVTDNPGRNNGWQFSVATYF
ncbi:hypothetical protein MYX04_12590 [Nitrospiraceae bacterium AH_259_D15_M11_P09]|nr:hypothetical protein [Nitrospiraceae bacterium AH_259_D15_M11_P09]